MKEMSFSSYKLIQINILMQKLIHTQYIFTFQELFWVKKEQILLI